VVYRNNANSIACHGDFQVEVTPLNNGTLRTGRLHKMILADAGPRQADIVPANRSGILVGRCHP